MSSHDRREGTVRVEDFSAPYHFFAEKLYLFYRVPRARILAGVAAPYTPRAVLGAHLAVFEIARFFQVAGSGHSPPIPTYNEVIHWTPAFLDGRPTYCMWKLYLDEPMPILLGRELYGFPKHAARIDYEKGADRIAVSVVPEQGPTAEVVAVLRSWRSLVPVGDAFVTRLATALFTGAELAFVHPSPGGVTVARVYDLRMSGARLVGIERARIPLFVALGLFGQADLVRPLVALHVPSFRISLGAPQRSPRHGAPDPGHAGSSTARQP